MRNLTLHLFVAIAIVTSSAAGAANLFQNPSFDDDVAGWVPEFGSTIERGPADELGSPTSGSLVAKATLPGQSGVGALQCVQVVAGRTYVFGAAARLPEVPPGNSALVSVDWYTMPDCSGPQIAGVTVLPYFMRLRGVWGPTQRWETAPPGAQSGFVRFNAFAVGTPQSTFRAEFDNAFFLEDASCASTPTTLCLNDGRFRVVVEWLTKQGSDGFGHAVPLTGDSGYFWFFNDANVELVTKLLDACSTGFNTFWFFGAGLTNVQTIIHVHDTATDLDRMYMNQQETPFAPIQDTSAFATCP